MTGQDIIIIRGIEVCRQGGAEQQATIPYLYLALSPAARKHLSTMFSPDEINLLEKFINDNHTALEKDGYKLEPEIRRGEND